MRSALVLGATGLIGGCLTAQLLDHPAYERVVTLGRRPTGLNHPKLEERVADLGQMADHREAFAVDDLYCCLGTTIKKAGSQAAFRRVDYEYPLAAAQLSKESGVQRCLLVSAMGADAHSPIFYNQVKGEVEEAVAAVGLPTCLIFRPSLLLGERQEVRLGEAVAGAVGRLVGPLMVGAAARYRPVRGETVARAMVNAALTAPPGLTVYASHEIQRLGEGQPPGRR